MDNRERLNPNIEWEYSGAPNINVGPGATRAEHMLPWLGAIGLVLFVGSAAVLRDVSWTTWQWALAFIFAIDIGGGVVANSLNSCKRFYHSPLRPDEKGLTALAKNHAIFAALHVHTIVLYLVWVPGSLAAGIAWYLALLAAAASTRQAPLYLARPIATLCVASAIAAATVFPGPRGMEWLVPLLFLKVVLGHATREEPYRP